MSTQMCSVVFTEIELINVWYREYGFIPYTTWLSFLGMLVCDYKYDIPVDIAKEYRDKCHCYVYVGGE